jgi:hypothetical protein
MPNSTEFPDPHSRHHDATLKMQGQHGAGANLPLTGISNDYRIFRPNVFWGIRAVLL